VLRYRATGSCASDNIPADPQYRYAGEVAVHARRWRDNHFHFALRTHTGMAQKLHFRNVVKTNGSTDINEIHTSCAERNYACTKTIYSVGLIPFVYEHYFPF
jgi:hypothetical protein